MWPLWGISPIHFHSINTSSIYKVMTSFLIPSLWKITLFSPNSPIEFVENNRPLHDQITSGPFHLLADCMGKGRGLRVKPLWECSDEAAGDEGWTLAFGDADQRRDAHRAIVSGALVFSPVRCRARAKAQINSIWAGRGAPRGCSSNRQHRSEHMITAQPGFFPHCKSRSVSVLWSYHCPELVWTLRYYVQHSNNKG